MPSAQGHLLVRRRPKDGDAGSDAVRYWVVPSTTQIKRAQDGTMYPSVVTCEKRKQTGNSQPIATNEGTLYYTIGYTDGSVTARTLYGSTGVKATSTMAWIKFMLDISQVEVASETVSVVADGEDAYVLDLDNEMQGIPCDSSGNPTGSGTLASTNSTVYKGSKADTGWTFAKTDTGCTSSIDDKGTVSVTAISADKASVKVTAMKGSVSLVAIMSLYKVKAGAPGTSPVVYSIETSVSAIGRNAAGTLNPKSFTAYKNKTEGAKTTRTKEKILKYRRMGQDTSFTTLADEGGTIEGMSASCTAIQIELYDIDGTTVLDVETIPIVKDGQKGGPGDPGEDGDDAVRYWIVPSATSIVKSQSGSYTPTSVSFDVMCQIGCEDPFEVSGMFIRYKFNYTTGLLQFWRKYTENSSLSIPSGARNLQVELYASQGSSIVSDVVGDGVCLDKVTIPIIFDGKDGNQGIQGCIYRRSKHDIGFEYHNDTALKTDGIRYIDLVYIMKDSTMYASHALWFRCRETHTSDANNAPQITNNGTEAWLKYWEPLNTVEPLYTPLLLADDAVITLMQSNQILIENDEGVITAGMSGSLAGSKIRIWAGAQTPDSAPFRVDVDGKLVATKATITGEINATKGKIAGFNISGTSLTNGPEFSNDACIIFRNDTHKTFAGIGGNVLPAVSGNRAVARFENEDNNNFWGLGRNIAMLLSAKNGDINHAFLGSGNGNLDGWIGGYKYSKYSLSANNTIYDGYLKISQNNKWIVYATGSNSGITLPTLTQVRNALGIDTSTSFCIEFTVCADLLSPNNFHIYGRCKKEVTVNGSTQTPYYTGEYPAMTNWNNGRYDSLEMGAGDAATFLLIYDPNKTGVLDTTYALKYTARIINRQN